MDDRALGALFRRIILAGAPLLATGCSNNYGCPPPDQDVIAPVNVVPTDAATMDGGLADLLSRCQASASDCTALCQHVVPQATSATLKQCELVSLDSGGFGVHVIYKQFCVGGRRNGGLLAPADARASNPLGAWLADCAHLEAASVDAFEILQAEIAAHRGPPPLIEGAVAAAQDERWHARVIGSLAARHGCAPSDAKTMRGEVRDLESIARENAVEGCTRETYAALIAWRQAHTAADPEIRTAMATIARDETRHAALAWAVDGWASGALPPAARRRVRDARHEASARLLAESSITLPPALRSLAGLPDPDEAARMVTALHAQLPS